MATTCSDATTCLQFLSIRAMYLHQDGFWNHGNKMANPESTLINKAEKYPSFIWGFVRLHNYCLKMGEGRKKLMKVYRVPGNMQLPHEPQIFRYVPLDAPNIISREGSSILRNVLRQRIHERNLKRPIDQSLCHALMQKRNSLYE